MIVLQQLSYAHPDKHALFTNINFTVNTSERLALVGNNGSGKSTLLHIIAGNLQASGGHITIASQPYLVPQTFGQYNHLTVAAALGISEKLHALQQILDGHTDAVYFDQLQDDWTIAERAEAALAAWGLSVSDLQQPMEALSGGQKTKVFLAGIAIHKPALILMDEPTNHLDAQSREHLYRFIETCKATLLIVSHDRKLLNLMPAICELTTGNIQYYGGNYEHYLQQKQLEQDALQQDIHSHEKALRKAREKERESVERQQKRDARGKAKQEKAGVAKIMMNTLRNNAENSTAKTKDAHAEKVQSIGKELQQLRDHLPAIDKMKFDFTDASLHKGKILCSATAVNVAYSGKFLWPEALSFQISSGERIALKGGNGSGKTTLIQLILGLKQPDTGALSRAAFNHVYIDQEYALLENGLTVYEQAQAFNTGALQEHEIKTRLNRFLFTRGDWDKTCGMLSGGERMRLLLCCLNIGRQAPEMIVLDEPTNNLDISNVEILSQAIQEYRGTLVLVSHDEAFAKSIGTDREIILESGSS
ncbi:ABC-F family ATP-binding cassette domain-containing protein [Rurimicrobium arvi]|uniref:ABC-F family ATP-binding cassette domain-containing protein n=2 Tax=Rurimicrobium arvi TaxID=2049916 RepID=A0ABP8MPS2_9BACT